MNRGVGCRYVFSAPWRKQISARFGGDSALPQFEIVVRPVRFPAEDRLTTNLALKVARATPKRILDHAVFTTTFETDQILHEFTLIGEGELLWSLNMTARGRCQIKKRRWCRSFADAMPPALQGHADNGPIMAPCLSKATGKAPPC